MNFVEGPLDTTNRPLDIAIEGTGFFQVLTHYNGSEVIAYTRAGNFTVNADGQIVMGNSDGSILEPEIQLPRDFTKVEIDRSTFEVSLAQAEAQLDEIRYDLAALAVFKCQNIRLDDVPDIGEIS